MVINHLLAGMILQSGVITPPKAWQPSFPPEKPMMMGLEDM